MEGLNSFEKKSPSAELNETTETLEESIERAVEIHTELKALDGYEVVGGDAMALNAQAEALATELKDVLKCIPSKECVENGLPYHPTDEKFERERTPFPELPDYPLPYEVAATKLVKKAA